MLLGIIDGVLDRPQLLLILFGDRDAELLLEIHDQLDRVERIGAPRSSVKEASGVICSGFTDSLRSMISYTFSFNH